jgi:hypothetical protein
VSYEAVTENIRNAAGKAKSAAERIAGIALDTAAADIAGALPGSKSAGAADRVSKSWKSTLKTWERDAGDHGAALDTTAKEYSRNDQAGADAFRRIAAEMKEQAG